MCQINKKIHGFTIIELMLSTVFVGSLLLAITMVIMRVSYLYNTGLTIKEVNSVSRILVRDVQQSIMNSEVFALRYYDGTTNPSTIRMADKFEEIKDGTKSDYYSNSAGGRFCTGTYSYAWNTGRAIKARNESGASKLDGFFIQFIKKSDGTDELVRFVRVRDDGKNLCRASASSDGSGPSLDPNIYLPAGNTGANYQNVFGEGNNNLVLYKISIDSPGIEGVPNSGGVVGMPDTELVSTVPYYIINLVIGTQTGDEIIGTNESCSPPASATQNRSEYCAINKIDFVARSGVASR